MADSANKKIDPSWAWEPYQPSDKAPWDLRRAGHLYRRAAFGANAAELDKAVKDGPDKTIAYLFKGGASPDKYEETVQSMEQSIAASNNGVQLRAWWLYRMLKDPHPLQEKLTLFWHNHFATSYAKVQKASFMLGQYDLMRKYALGNFADLLRDMDANRVFFDALIAGNLNLGNYRRGPLRPCDARREHRRDNRDCQRPARG